MTGGEIGLGRIRAIVRRRRVPVLVTAAVAAALGLVWVARLAPTYQARAVVRIDDPRPGRDYVVTTVSEPGIERLRSARVGWISRPVVEDAAARAGILKESDGPDARARITSGLAARLDARAEGEDTFVLTFADSERDRAQAFLAGVIQAYTERRRHDAREQARATAEFFAAEVDALRPRVAAAQTAAERFRIEHYGDLPDQLDGNSRMLEETEGRAHTLSGSLDAALNRRRAMLAEAQSPLRRQEEDVGRALSQARARYAADAPEIAALATELARVREERRAEEEALARAIRRGPELASVDAEIAGLRAALDEARGRTELLRGRLEAAAQNAEELVKLTLERDVLRDRLRALVSKQEEAALAAGLEAGVAGRARIAVVEPAWVTSGPVRPARPLLGAIALAIAAGLGLGLGWLLDATDRRVRELHDVRAVTGDLPVLGVVPRLDQPRATHRKIA